MEYINTYVQEDWYYKVYTKEDTAHHFLRRQEALDYYKNCGTKIDIIYKDSRKPRTIIDKPNIDTERLKSNLELKKTTKSQRNAIYKYDKANTKQITLKLNLNTDREIIEFLDHTENKQGLIKQLILEHKQQQEKENEYKYILINRIREMAQATR